MDVAALVAWVLTAIGGFVMLGRWVGRGGLRQQRDATAFPPALVFGHFGLAAAGLVLWIVYLLVDSAPLAWVAFVVLILVAALGFTLLSRWSAGRRHASTAGVSPGGSASGVAARPAEQTLPVPIVAAHGVLAVATVVLVLLAALAG
jgi:manganese efflux pump family protein